MSQVSPLTTEVMRSTANRGRAAKCGGDEHDTVSPTREWSADPTCPVHLASESASLCMSAAPRPWLYGGVSAERVRTRRIGVPGGGHKDRIRRTRDVYRRWPRIAA